MFEFNVKGFDSVFDFRFGTDHLKNEWDLFNELIANVNKAEKYVIMSVRSHLPKGKRFVSRNNPTKYNTFINAQAYVLAKGFMELGQDEILAPLKRNDKGFYTIDTDGHFISIEETFNSLIATVYKLNK